MNFLGICWDRLLSFRSDRKRRITDVKKVFAVFLFIAVLGCGSKASADGFVFNGTSFSILNFPGAVSTPSQNSTVATGINNSGEIIGNYETDNAMTGSQQNGFVYANGVFTSLD